MVVAPISLYANNKYHFSMSDTVLFSMDCCILLVHFFLSLSLAKYKTVPDTTKKNLKKRDEEDMCNARVTHSPLSFLPEIQTVLLSRLERPNGIMGLD